MMFQLHSFPYIFLCYTFHCLFSFLDFLPLICRRGFSSRPTYNFGGFIFTISSFSFVSQLYSLTMRAPSFHLLFFSPFDLSRESDFIFAHWESEKPKKEGKKGVEIQWEPKKRGKHQNHTKKAWVRISVGHKLSYIRCLFR